MSASLIGKMIENISYEITFQSVVDGINANLAKDKPGYKVDEDSIKFIKGRKGSEEENKKDIKITMDIVKIEE